MPLIIPSGFAQVTHFFSGAALPNGAAMTYGVTQGGAVSAPTDCAFLHDALADHLAVYWADAISLTTTRLKLGPNATGPFFEFTDARPGALTADPLPPNCCYLIEKQTALGGRAGRGRMYMPGVAEDGVLDGGAQLPARVSALNRALATWWNVIVNEGLIPQLFHSASSDPTEITDFNCDPVVATQRRRLR